MDQNYHAANFHWLFDPILQKSAEDFFMPVLDSVCAEGSVSCTNLFVHSAVVEARARQQHEYICQVIAEGLDRAPSLPEFSANGNSAVVSSLGTSSACAGSGEPVRL